MPIRATILVLTILLAAAAVTLVATPAHADGTCSGATNDNCNGYVVCVNPHRDSTGNIQYCDTAVYSPANG